MRIKPMTKDIKRIISKLSGEVESQGYYYWIPLDYTEKSLWLLRIPRWTSDLVEEWMLDEKVECVHICSVGAFITAMEMQEYEALHKVSGYVRERQCSKCEVPVTEPIAKKLSLGHMFKR